jgi:hypothetical protein
MPMLSPKVWVIHAPAHAIPCDNATDATERVNVGETVVLADYETGIATLISLGADPDRAAYLAEVARKQPRFQEKYEL